MKIISVSFQLICWSLKSLKSWNLLIWFNFYRNLSGKHLDYICVGCVMSWYSSKLVLLIASRSVVYRTKLRYLAVPGIELITLQCLARIESMLLHDFIKMFFNSSTVCWKKNLLLLIQNLENIAYIHFLTMFYESVFSNFKTLVKANYFFLNTNVDIAKRETSFRLLKPKIISRRKGVKLMFKTWSFS